MLPQSLRSRLLTWFGRQATGGFGKAGALSSQIHVCCCRHLPVVVAASRQTFMDRRSQLGSAQIKTNPYLWLSGCLFTKRTKKKKYLNKRLSSLGFIICTYTHTSLPEPRTRKSKDQRVNQNFTAKWLNLLPTQLPKAYTCTYK
jgi:hypothetical protein